MDGEWLGWGMKFILSLITFLSLSASAFSNSEWFYYKHYPWVYDNVTKDWLYLRGVEGGKIYAYKQSTKTWAEFSMPSVEKTWEEKYSEWIKNPEPYGGLDALKKIKDANVKKLFKFKNLNKFLLEYICTFENER